MVYLHSGVYFVTLCRLIRGPVCIEATLNEKAVARGQARVACRAIVFVAIDGLALILKTLEFRHEFVEAHLVTLINSWTNMEGVQSRVGFTGCTRRRT